MEEVESIAIEGGYLESFVWFRQGFWFGWGKSGDKAAG
jgi:hypothetical protein